jgi:hypothetical protein
MAYPVNPFAASYLPEAPSLKDSSMALTVAVLANRTRKGCHGTVGEKWRHQLRCIKGPAYPALGMHHTPETSHSLS